MTQDSKHTELQETELDSAVGGFMIVWDFVKAPKGERSASNRSDWTDFQEHPD